ncbi:MAG: hypothetical protein RIC37_09770 [Gammaproteobacteria bacterium]
MLTGFFTRFRNQTSTIDWASNGQPILERWFDKQEWFVEGFIPGAIVGILVGLLWVLIQTKMNKKSKK